MARPYVGPLIDFRVPKEHKLRAEEIAAAQGRFVDEVCREIFSAGLEAVDSVQASLGRRTGREAVAGELKRAGFVQVGGE